MIARLANAAWLVVVWLIATESLTTAAVVGGVLAAALTTKAFVAHPDADEPTTFRLWYVLVFLGHFAVKLAQANVQVASAVVSPAHAELRRGIVAVPVVPTAGTIIWLLANTVSLRPGTSVVELRSDPPILYVHVLLLTSVEAVQHDVLDMQRRLVRALGTADALDEIDHRIAVLEARLAASAEPVV